MTLFFLNLLGDYCNPQHRVTSIATAFWPPPTFKWKLPPCFMWSSMSPHSQLTPQRLGHCKVLALWQVCVHHLLVGRFEATVHAKSST